MHVIVSGYYGFRNAGDEAVLAGIIAGMRRVVTNLDLTAISGDPQATADSHQVRAIGRFDVRALRRELGNANMLISGGGNLFQDATSARSCLYYLAIVNQALRAQVPVLVLGQGIGPLRRRWLRALVRRYLNRVQGIAARDSESARELERMGVTAPPVRVGVDLSFAMDLPAGEQVTQAWRDLGIDDAATALAMAPRVWRVRGARRKVLARLAEAINRAVRDLQPRPQVVVFPMQRPHDDEACRALADAVEGMFAQPELPPALLAAMIGGARATVGMRLHALMFAVMGGRMPVAVSYDPKVEAFMRDLGLSTTATTTDIDEGRLAAAIVDAWRASDEERATLRQAAADHRRVVSEMFAWAVDLARNP